MTKLTPRTKRTPSLRITGWLFVPLALIVMIYALFALKPDGRLGGGVGQALAGETMSKDEFEQRVRAYVLEHPEVIGEAINRLEARQREQEAKQTQAALHSHIDDIFHDPHDPVGGNLNGDATIVEFFDYNCPYCRLMAPVMIQAQTADSRLRVVYKEFPILGPNSLFAARAALAANKQGKYVEFHRALYQVRGPVDENKVMEVAKSLGLDVARLKADMQEPEIGVLLDRNIKLARVLGINGTPGFAAGDKVFAGATDLKSLQTMIEASRKSAAATTR
jgi:protein-disulfide isomerase